MLGIGSISYHAGKASVFPVLRMWEAGCRRNVLLPFANLAWKTGKSESIHTYAYNNGSSLVSFTRLSGVCGSCESSKQIGRTNRQSLKFYSSAKPKPSSDKALQESSDRAGGAVTLSAAEKVKENVKTASYGAVIVVGVIIGGALLYFVLSELFSSESPNNIYTHAFKLCKLSTEVQDALGTPIKCYGEETRRGWRRHVAFQEFLDGDTKLLRMKFYIEGPFKKGTVNLEKRTNEKGKYMYKYIVVEVDGYPPRMIHVPF